MTYKVLYSFTSPLLDLVEVKRLCLPEGTPLSDVYHWLVVESGQVVGLRFKASWAEGQIQKREFFEGRLQFDSLGGSLTYSGKTHPLSALSAQSTSPEVISLIERYLRLKSAQNFKS